MSTCCAKLASESEPLLGFTWVNVSVSQLSEAGAESKVVITFPGSVVLQRPIVVHSGLNGSSTSDNDSACTTTAGSFLVIECIPGVSAVDFPVSAPSVVQGLLQPQQVTANGTDCGFAVSCPVALPSPSGKALPTASDTGIISLLSPTSNSSIIATSQVMAVASTSYSVSSAATAVAPAPQSSPSQQQTNVVAIVASTAAATALILAIGAYIILRTKWLRKHGGQNATPYKPPLLPNDSAATQNYPSPFGDASTDYNSTDPFLAAEGHHQQPPYFVHLDELGTSYGNDNMDADEWNSDFLLRKSNSEGVPFRTQHRFANQANMGDQYQTFPNGYSTQSLDRSSVESRPAAPVKFYSYDDSFYRYGKQDHSFVPYPSTAPMFHSDFTMQPVAMNQFSHPPVPLVNVSHQQPMGDNATYPFPHHGMPSHQNQNISSNIAGTGESPGTAVPSNFVVDNNTLLQQQMAVIQMQQQHLQNQHSQQEQHQHDSLNQGSQSQNDLNQQPTTSPYLTTLERTVPQTSNEAIEAALRKRRQKKLAQGWITADSSTEGSEYDDETNSSVEDEDEFPLELAKVPESRPQHQLRDCIAMGTENGVDQDEMPLATVALKALQDAMKR